MKIIYQYFIQRIGKKDLQSYVIDNNLITPNKLDQLSYNLYKKAEDLFNKSKSLHSSSNI